MMNGEDAIKTKRMIDHNLINFLLGSCHNMYSITQVCLHMDISIYVPLYRHAFGILPHNWIAWLLTTLVWLSQKLISILSCGKKYLRHTLSDSFTPVEFLLDCIFCKSGFRFSPFFSSFFFQHDLLLLDFKWQKVLYLFVIACTIYNIMVKIISCPATKVGHNNKFSND